MRSDSLVVKAGYGLFMFSWQLVYQLTFTRAIPSPLFNTVIAADKQRVANLVGAMIVSIAFVFATEVTSRNDLISYPFPQTLIKDKVLAFKFVL